ncbi:MAG: DUF362 domain-containing protein [Chloroflexota bacterium]|nr:DUF362 domain-containing protein [Chloroflexota bacterium]
MTREHNRSDPPRSQGISRREFIRMAAMAGLLAGCRPVEKLVTPTSAPSPTPPPSPTAAPTIKQGRVVRTRHAGVWDGDDLVPAAIRQMLDASITELTGLNDAAAAWAALFDPGERVAIKVNAFRNSIIWTHVPLVIAVTECLQGVGVPAEQIVIFDYRTSELTESGYPVNVDGPGVRCYGTDRNYTAGWEVKSTGIELSDILLGCDALINMPVLKVHSIAGISFAMKNHYGSFSRPDLFHNNIGKSIAQLNSLPPIKDSTRLIIGDVLAAALKQAGSWPYWEADFTGDSILMSFDPVAHDAVGLQMLSQMLTDSGASTAAVTSLTRPCLENGAELGLGTNDPDEMELLEVSLG